MTALATPLPSTLPQPTEVQSCRVHVDAIEVRQWIRMNQRLPAQPSPEYWQQLMNPLSLHP